MTSVRRIYLDHNATTPVRPEVLEAMLPFLQNQWGNPSSIYSIGQQARSAVEAARAQVAGLINAKSAEEIVFTSCGSESDVLAIWGACLALSHGDGAKKQVVTSAIEHDAIRILCSRLHNQGYKIVELPVDKSGSISVDSVQNAITDATAIVSIMHANNEVGTIQPIAEIAAVCREKGVLFHTDAVQSVGRLKVDVQALGVDMLALSGHKINAPKGIGALYVRKGVRLAPIVTGHQEKNRRGGTENVAGIVALGKACDLAAREFDSHAKTLLKLRKKLEEGCLKIEGCAINGHPDMRLPGTTHLSFDGIEGHPLVVALDLEGICASAGPACSAGAAEPSHVLQAMGMEPARAIGSLRLSVGWGSSDADIERVLEVLPAAVKKLRAARKEFSPR